MKSSARLKEPIQPVSEVNESILVFDPVTDALYPQIMLPTVESKARPGEIAVDRSWASYSSPLHRLFSRDVGPPVVQRIEQGFLKLLSKFERLDSLRTRITMRGRLSEYVKKPH